MGFEGNLYGSLHCMRPQLAAMTQAKKGAIVNMCSLSSTRPIPHYGHYSSSKMALLGMQQVAALESAASGVRVNSVSPGHTLPSEMLQKTLSNMDNMGEAGQAFVGAVYGSPQGKVANAMDVFQAVAFLMDDT